MAGTFKGGPDMAQPIAAIALDDLEHRITLTVEEVASLLGLGRTAAYEAARRGQIPSRRVGRRVIVPVPALLEWLGADRRS
jgi:excisionase family DNA binding protein